MRLPALKSALCCECAVVTAAGISYHFYHQETSAGTAGYCAGLVSSAAAGTSSFFSRALTFSTSSGIMVKARSTVLGAIGQLDGADAAILDDEERHGLDVDARTGSTAKQILVCGILAVKIRSCGSKAKRHLGHREDGGSILGLDGFADDGVGICHLADLIHRHVH